MNSSKLTGYILIFICASFMVGLFPFMNHRANFKNTTVCGVGEIVNVYYNPSDTLDGELEANKNDWGGL